MKRKYKSPLIFVEEIALEESFTAGSAVVKLESDSGIIEEEWESERVYTEFEW